jgi:hypothetical protein
MTRAASILWSLGLWVSCSLGPSLARAHDPYESWSAAILHPDRLELTVTMAQSTALRLIDPEAKIRGLTPQTFALHRSQFEREAVGLFILTSGRTTPLAGRKPAVEFTDENDVVFTLSYPRPAPGRLHFHAAFLKKLGASYGGILEVNLPGGENIGWEQLSFENVNFELTVSPPRKPQTRP